MGKKVRGGGRGEEEGKRAREKSSKSGTPGQLCDWACLAQTGRTRGPAPYYADPPREATRRARERERDARASESPAGSQDPRRRRKRAVRVLRRVGNGRQVRRRPLYSRTWARPRAERRRGARCRYCRPRYNYGIQRCRGGRLAIVRKLKA